MTSAQPPRVAPGVHQISLLERVVHGRRAAEVLPEEIGRSGARRVFVVSTASLAGTEALDAIVAALGDAAVGVFTGVRAHAPRECVIQGAMAANALRADLLLAVGGGSVIDAAKVMLLAMRHGCTQAAQLDPYAGTDWTASQRRPDDRAQWRRMMAVPTTFSAAEYTAVGGATESASRAKQGFGHPMMMPIAVINDPWLSATAPLELLLSTGMKALDHAVERLTSKAPSFYSDCVSAPALSLLARGLRAMKAAPGDIGVRADLQMGVFMSMAGAAAGTRSNLAHAMAHAMGSLCDVPHGLTSCVLLPAVLRWVAQGAVLRQRMLCEAMGDAGDAGDDAAAAVARLVADLGLPSRLRDVGVRPEQLDTIAERTLHDPRSANCARAVETAEQVREVLEMAW
jgi:maleylacetate reductase